MKITNSKSISGGGPTPGGVGVPGTAGAALSAQPMAGMADRAGTPKVISNAGSISGPSYGSAKDLEYKGT